MRKVVWKVTCTGHKRTFRVVTADGKEYTTTRQDSLYSAYQWGGGYAIELRTIKANDMMDVGIKYGIQVDQGDVTKPVYVQPILVEHTKSEEITLTKELEKSYLIFKPKKPDEFIPSSMKCEEVEE